VDLADAGLADGVWTMHTVVTRGRTTACLPIGAQGTCSGPLPDAGPGHEVGFDAAGELAARIGAGLPLAVRLRPGDLTLKAGRLVLRTHAPEVAGPLTLHLSRRGTGREVAVPLVVTGDLLTGTLDLAGSPLTPGRWRMTIGEGTRRAPLRPAAPAGGRPDQVSSRVAAPAGGGPDRVSSRVGALVGGRRERVLVGGRLRSVVWVEPAGRNRNLTLVAAGWRDIVGRLRARGRRLFKGARKS